jgi:hypothetical protein
MVRGKKWLVGQNAKYAITIKNISKLYVRCVGQEEITLPTMIK